MVIGMGDDPSIGEYERLLLSMKTTARKELVLLHPDRSVVPGSTREWLKVIWLPLFMNCRSLTCFRIDPGFTNTFILNYQYATSCSVMPLARRLTSYSPGPGFGCAQVRPISTGSGCGNCSQELEGQGAK
jgi:hypothetical protein